MSDRSPTPLALKLPVRRARMVLLGLLLAFTGLGIRAAVLQVVEQDSLQAQGHKRHLRVVELPAHRGTITDRHGTPLALSTPMESVMYSPTQGNAVDEGQRSALARELEMDRRDLDVRLAHTRGVHMLRRQLSPDRAARVRALGVTGIFTRTEPRRYYPAGDVLAHVVGFTDVDERGREGMELALDQVLSGQPGSRRVIQDPRGRVIDDLAGIVEPRQGREVALSIDLDLQYVATRELRAAVAEHRAEAGSAVVVDAATGEILALANVPTYNPNNRSAYDVTRARNRAVTDQFEPGSTMKPFTLAMALESGRYRPESMVDTGRGALTVGKSTIHDHEGHGRVTLAEVLQKSSNVGTVRVALSLPARSLWQVWTEAGFGTPTGLGFPGEAAGRVRDPSTWRPVEHATMSYGHGVSVSLLQLVRAYSVFRGDGHLLPVSLLRRGDVPEGEPAMSATTSTAMRDMLELVTQKGGTAPQARIPGYRVAGKTGTARKVVGRGYEQGKYVANFIGFAPASQPRLLVGVAIDSPSAGRYYAGEVAAPVAARILGAALRALNVPHDLPLDAPPVPVASQPEET